MAHSSNRRGSASASNELYTQFCIGVELGDDTLVRDLVLRGANTMVSYGVDGVIKTPMQSALTKGDLPMALALLTSRSTKVRLADVDAAPKVKRDLMTPILVRRMSDALEDGAREMLLQRTLPVSRTRPSKPTVKVSLSESLGAHLRALEDSEPLQKASSTDRPRCPPGDSAIPPPESEDDEESETQTEEEGDESDEGVEVESIASSAGDSSVDGNQ